MVMPREYTRPRRCTQRVGTVGLLEAHTLRRQTIHRRCVQVLIPGATHRPDKLLIGEDVENVKVFRSS